MDGVGGKPGWAWIFILEGLATIVAGAASFFIIQDFPDTARFLSEVERAMVIRRLQNDDQFSAGGELFKSRNILSSLKDWKTWLGSKHDLSVTHSNAQLGLTGATILVGMYIGCLMPLYAFALFLPSIIHEVRLSLSFDNVKSVPTILAWWVHSHDKILNKVSPFSPVTQGSKPRQPTYSRFRCMLSLAVSLVSSASQRTGCNGDSFLICVAFTPPTRTPS